MNLDKSCSQHFTFQDLIECSETFHATHLSNKPLNPESWQALSLLAVHILDPVVDRFGTLSLTYGFSSSEMVKARRTLVKSAGTLPAIYPPLDQHSACENNAHGDRICERGGAACDFLIIAKSSLCVAQWIVGNLPFDRLYYYAPDKPLHVSYNKEQRAGEVTVMKPKSSGRGFIPGTMQPEAFLERYGEES